MSDIFGRIRCENQLVFLNTGKLIGINSLSISQNLGAQPLNYIGIQNKQVNQILNNEQFSEASINGFLIDSDQFIQYTGVDCFNLFILQNQGVINNGISLISGYLNSYGLKFSIGQPTEFSSTIKFVNDAGFIPTGLLPISAYNQLIQIPSNVYEDTEKHYGISSYHSTDLIIDEIQTNRVAEASIALSISRTPIYNIGNKFPSKVKTIYPILVNCSFTFEISPDFSGLRLQDFPANVKTQNIIFNLYEYNNPSNLINSYNFSGLNLINERNNITVDGSTTITRDYIGYIYN